MEASETTKTIRRAIPEEAATLAALQNRSSTHWGYPPGFFDWAPEASVIPEDYIRDNHVFALDEGGRIVGFYGLTREEGDLLLDKLFVDIDRIGTGRGKLLWQHAVNTARELGYREMVIGSDPNAAPFYKAMGAEWYGEKDSGNPQWVIQMFRYRIPASPD
jgi:GNAT superfamily N-acetyltransferase